MYRPEPGWLPASSYVEPVTPPTTEPDASPGVSVCFSAEWLPYVLGSLQQLAQPTAWDTTSPSVLQTTLDRVQGLLELFGTAGACMLLRWSDADCALEQSTDGGATWTAISGWDIAGLASCLEVHLPPAPIVRWNSSDCLFEVSLDNGATYSTLPGFTIATLASCLTPDLPPQTAIRWNPADCAFEYSLDNQVTWHTIDGWTIPSFQGCLPGTPGNPQGVSVGQQACNIANWMAVQILQGSMTSVADSISAGKSLFQAVTTLIDLLPGVDLALEIGVTAGNVLFQAVTTLGTSAVNAAASDPVLAADLTCAIYNAIAADGHVTSANVATILTNINGISYGTTGIVGLIHDYVQALGYNGLAAMQAEGSLYAGSCPCGSTPISGGNGCAIFDGTDDFLTTGALCATPGTGNLTICFWINYSSSVTMSIVGQGGNSTLDDQFVVYLLGGGGGNQASIIRRLGGSSTGVETYTNSAIGTGAWHHIAIVSTSVSGVAIYVDGAVAATSQSSPVTPPFDAGAVQTTIGVTDANGGSPNRPYAGKMADLRLYDSLLSGAQIAAIAAGGVTGYVPEGSPTAWWAFNDVSGSTAHDYGSGAHDATWHGTGAHWSTI